MHALTRPTLWLRKNLTKAPGSILLEPDLTAKLRRVRLVIPNGVIVSVSLTENPADIGHGSQTYEWVELEGPQTNLVFHLTGEQHLAAILSGGSPAGLAPRCSIIVEYPEAITPE